MKMILAKNLSLPSDAPARTIAVFGQKGSGKTYLAMVLTEGMLEAGVQVVCLDPTGVWWGLKAEGTGPGFPILVMGGDHGDVPLVYTSGAIVADFVIQSGQSVVLDLSAFNTNGEQDRFVCDFAERLFRGMNSQRTALHVMMDEADAFAPQNPQRKGYEVRMLGAIETIVRRGRSRGLGMTMITQRPAVLNKNVVEQADLIIATRIVGKNDHAALRDMTKLRATKEQQDEFLAAVPTLKNGKAFFWSPEWLNCFEEHEILKKRTFDSSKTPEPGEKRKAPKLAKVDLAKLTAEIQATVDQAKQNDPAEQRREIGRLQNELASVRAALKKYAEAPPVEVPKEVSVFDAHDLDTMEELLKSTEALSRRLDEAMAKVKAPQPLRLPTRERIHPSPPAAPWKPITKTVVAAARPSNGSSPTDLPKGERDTLIAAAQHPQGITREQASILTGYKRSTRDTYIQRLGTRGYVSVENGIVTATDAGKDALGDFEALPTGSQLARYWLGRLPEGERRVLEIVLDQPASREEISERTGYKRSTRDTYIQRLGVRKLVSSGSQGIMASSELFD
jgi:hypothetical protein